MGMNYYLKRKVMPPERKAYFQELLDNDDMYRLSQEAEEELKVNRIHIGKSSMGWQFLFDPNHLKYYQPNRESVNQFLTQENYSIVDEIGEEMSVEEFWQLVDSKKDKISCAEYYRDHMDELASVQYYMRPDLECAKYDRGLSDFITEDGLRFSTSTDFS